MDDVRIVHGRSYLSKHPNTAGIPGNGVYALRGNHRCQGTPVWDHPHCGVRIQKRQRGGCNGASSEMKSQNDVKWILIILKQISNKQQIRNWYYQHMKNKISIGGIHIERSDLLRAERCPPGRT